MSFPKVLIYGGKGALGAAIAKYFKAKNWWVCSIDLFPNEDADSNVIVSPTDSWTDQLASVSSKVAEVLDSEKVQAILCVAGGWAGGNAANDDFIKNADLMWKQSVWSASIAASLAARHLQAGGLLTLPGAQPCLKGTPSMMGYGMAKAAVHQLTKSLASPDSGLPEGACAVTILPVTLDTPMNRKFMSSADFTTWTPLDFVAELFFTWAASSDSRPESGSLLQLLTKDSKTEVVPA